MAIMFNTIGQYEKVYSFEDAVIETAMYNGTFGEVTDGKFVAAANGTKAIMTIEKGDDENMDKYLIPAGSHVRVLDLVDLAEQYPKNPRVEVYGYPLPDTYVVGDMLVSDAEGKLVTGGAAPCLEVEKVLGNKAGVLAKIVTE